MCSHLQTTRSAKAADTLEKLLRLSPVVPVASHVKGNMALIALIALSIVTQFVSFIHQVARLVARIASAEVPAICGHILTCGDLVALHKLDAGQQAEATAAGKAPSLRPVNKGCNILKWALKLAVRSKPALAAARKLEPLQSGLAKRGPEAFCHSLRALGEKGVKGLCHPQDRIPQWLQRNLTPGRSGRSPAAVPGTDRPDEPLLHR